MIKQQRWINKKHFKTGLTLQNYQIQPLNKLKPLAKALNKSVDFLIFNETDTDCL